MRIVLVVVVAWVGQPSLEAQWCGTAGGTIIEKNIDIDN